jgi:hypothetical protein
MFYGDDVSDLLNFLRSRTGSIFLPLNITLSRLARIPIIKTIPVLFYKAVNFVSQFVVFLVTIIVRVCVYHLMRDLGQGGLKVTS